MPRRLTNHPVEWFADDTGTVLGAIAYETREFAWSVVILGRDALGMFRAFDRDISVGRLVVRGGCSSTGWCRRWRW